MDRDCPKCQNQGLVPIWHRDHSYCRPKDTSKPRQEHLHYYCRCGYDFTNLIGEGQDVAQ